MVTEDNHIVLMLGANNTNPSLLVAEFAAAIKLLENTNVYILQVPHNKQLKEYFYLNLALQNIVHTYEYIPKHCLFIRIVLYIFDTSTNRVKCKKYYSVPTS